MSVAQIPEGTMPHSDVFPTAAPPFVVTAPTRAFLDYVPIEQGPTFSRS